MPGYKPLYVKGVQGGLVQSREEFILPDDAYPVLENAYVWRERIKRKQGFRRLGRLRRNFTSVSLGNTGGAGGLFRTLSTTFSLESTSQIVLGSVIITIGSITYTDDGNGNLISSTSPTNPSGTINYSTTDIAIVGSLISTAATITFSYYPGLPVMGIREQDITSQNIENTVFFDTSYAYVYNNMSMSFQELIEGTTWTGTNSNFFWTTNYFVDSTSNKIFWATNFNDPIRFTNGNVWTDFAPPINAAGDVLSNCLCMLPFRGRLVTFNTVEGPEDGQMAFTRRVRWCAIGTPFYQASTGITTFNTNSWKDDIRGQGGFLDIPISEDIVSVGFVRDNVVIYCEHSTWQLRYTGQSVAPFKPEKINSELGANSTFSAVQFDTSLVGIGDKGIVECDSYKSIRIDIKIPDFVFFTNHLDSGDQRIQGVRNFQQKLAFWTFVDASSTQNYTQIFPNRRLVYNYENDSWAIFTDSLTTLGLFQTTNNVTWANLDITWAEANFDWVTKPAEFPLVVGGNQQGYVFILDSQTSNDASLAISDITADSVNATIITANSHNLQSEQVIQINDLPDSDPFASLNGGIFGVQVLDANTFQIYTYSLDTDMFDIPQINVAGTTLGGGQVYVRDGFTIQSKKFNFLDEGQTIQIGYVDVLMDTTTNGEVTLNVYLDYNDDAPINRIYENILADSEAPDTFFNSQVMTSQQSGLASSKCWQRVICPARGKFITLEWTLSNAQLNGEAQESDVQIDSQIIWMRPAGNQLNYVP